MSQLDRSGSRCDVDIFDIFWFVPLYFVGTTFVIDIFVVCINSVVFVYHWSRCSGSWHCRFLMDLRMLAIGLSFFGVKRVRGFSSGSMILPNSSWRASNLFWSSSVFFCLSSLLWARSLRGLGSSWNSSSWICFSAIFSFVFLFSNTSEIWFAFWGGTTATNWGEVVADFRRKFCY